MHTLYLVDTLMWDPYLQATATYNVPRSDVALDRSNTV